MDLKGVLKTRIEKENKKIQSLQRQIDKANIFIQGLQEALRLAGGEVATNESSNSTSYFRSGSTKDAYDTLKRTRKAMHIDELLVAQGKVANRKNRATLASSLHRAVKKTGLIASLGNNTFALSGDVDNQNEPGTEEDDKDNGIPANFGIDIAQEGGSEPDDLPF